MDQGRQHSRLSTFNVFARLSSKPPRPPPKDKIYLQSSASALSLTPSYSLSPRSASYASSSYDTLQVPQTPVTPPSHAHFAISRSLSPAPSFYPMSPSSATSTLSTDSSAFKKGLNKLSSLGKRPFIPRSASSKNLQGESPLRSPQPLDDGSISHPWNIQHHLHVDEGLAGLPSNWLASLRDAGLSDEEIMTIHARRQRSLNIQDHPDLSPVTSPAYPPLTPTALSPSNPYTVNTLPPRTDSLRRRPQLSPDAISVVSTAIQSYKSDASSYALSGSHPYAQGYASGHSSPPSSNPEVATDSSSERERIVSPSTPVAVPPRALHVANGSTSSMSPPPAYGLSEHALAHSLSFGDVKRAPEGGAARMHVGTHDSPRSRVEEELRQDGEDSDGSALSRVETVRARAHGESEKPSSPQATPASLLRTPPCIADHLPPAPSGSPPSPPHTPHGRTGSPSPPPSPLPRTSELPPRLSLHQDLHGDISSWTESLFSAFDPSERHTRAESSTIKPSGMSTRSSAKATPLTTSRTPVSSRSPPISPPLRSGTTSPWTPLFDEIMDLVHAAATPPSASRTPISDSPTLPRRMTPVSPTADADPGLLHSPAKGDRDSQMTVCPATIVRDVSITTATPAVASVIPSPLPKRKDTSVPAPPLPSPASVAFPSGSSSEDDHASARLAAARCTQPWPASPPARPASPHSVDSASSGSSASSQVTPLSVASGSGSSSEGVARAAVRVKSPHIAGEPALPSPTNSAGSRQRSAGGGGGKLRDEIAALYDEVETDCGSSVVDDWLVDSPTSAYADEADGDLKRNSLDVYDSERERLAQATADAARRRQPSISVNGVDVSAHSVESRHLVRPAAERGPRSPAQRYRGWLSEVVAPLEEFIDDEDEPHELFTDLQEIAEGESGSVYVARVVDRLRVRDLRADVTVVAIKNIPMMPSGSPKLTDLRRELLLMSRIRHENILSMDALYVDLTDDSLWIRMELMERSLADVLGLVDEGLVIQEKPMARFTNDILLALEHLETHGIAHRDVRSDNLLVNSMGVLKMAEFSNAVQVDPVTPMRSEMVGVVYWQAPEMRSGSYDARKVDVWSVGATVWEMAEAGPPFADIEDLQRLPDTWPDLSQPEIYTRSFHDFLRLCSLPPSSRPSSHDLLQTPFIRSACARPVIVKLLSQCRDIEERLHRRQSADSQGTILV